jgi:hypothetical protein
MLAASLDWSLAPGLNWQSREVCTFGLDNLQIITE